MAELPSGVIECAVLDVPVQLVVVVYWLRHRFDVVVRVGGLFTVTDSMERTQMVIRGGDGHHVAAVADHDDSAIRVDIRGRFVRQFVGNHFADISGGCILHLPVAPVFLDHS